MSNSIYSVIIGTGSYIPKKRITNEYFLENEFYESSGKPLNKSNQEIVTKFEEITTIAERRYVEDDKVTSDIAYLAAKKAIEDANIDPEELDHIILAHNFGDISHGGNRSDIMPTLAARVKHKLGIKNPFCPAYDITFGCPGWVQALIQANYYIKSGDAKKVLVIGADVLSRVYDKHDRDGMIFSDGAAAVVVEGKESATPIGILTHGSRSDTLLHSTMLRMGTSYNPENAEDLYMKMNGRRLYQYALETVAPSIKDCLDKAKIDIKDVKKVLIHQANGKMDDAILNRLYKLYGLEEAPEGVMPMTISWLGNSSVATVPTLLDLILKGELEGQEIKPGDVIVFASVGAGMHINAVIYKA